MLADAYPHGQPPGTVSLVEPDLNNVAHAAESFIQPHAMHPLNVLRMASAMKGLAPRVLLVGCEPAELGGDEGHIGLSKAVEGAVEQAVARIEALVKQLLDETGS